MPLLITPILARRYYIATRHATLLFIYEYDIVDDNE